MQTCALGNNDDHMTGGKKLNNKTKLKKEIGVHSCLMRTWLWLEKQYIHETRIQFASLVHVQLVTVVHIGCVVTNFGLDLRGHWKMMIFDMWLGPWWPRGYSNHELAIRIYRHTSSSVRMYSDTVRLTMVLYLFSRCNVYHVNHLSLMC